MSKPVLDVFCPLKKYDITCQNTGMAESTSMLFLRLDLVVFLLLFRDNIRDRHESNWRPKSLLRRLYCPASVHVVLWLGRENLTDTSCKDHLQNVIGFMTLKAYMILNRNENDRKIKKRTNEKHRQWLQWTLSPLIFTSLLQFLSKTMT